MRLTPKLFEQDAFAPDWTGPEYLLVYPLDVLFISRTPLGLRSLCEPCFSLPPLRRRKKKRKKKKLAHHTHTSQSSHPGPGMTGYDNALHTSQIECVNAAPPLVSGRYLRKQRRKQCVVLCGVEGGVPRRLPGERTCETESIIALMLGSGREGMGWRYKLIVAHVITPPPNSTFAPSIT